MFDSFFNIDISHNFINKPDINNQKNDINMFDFKLPISYLDKNKIHTISDDVKTDLEIDNDCSNNMYNYIFSPNNEFSRENIKSWNQYYTNDTEFLNDTQYILSKMNSFKQTTDTNFSNLQNIWNETKNNSNFYSKYNLFEWSFLKHLNLSSVVLLFMCLLHLSSPIFFFLMPVLVLIVPFFILKMQGIPISTTIYYTVLKDLIKKKLFGATINSFNSVNLYFILYVLGCLIFYCIQIYQNINTCYVFYKNIKNVNQYIIDLNSYLDHSIDNMNDFLYISSNLDSYSPFNHVLQHKLQNLMQLKYEITNITPFTHSISKVNEFGNLLKCFYIIHSNSDYESALQFSTGFNGYIYNMSNVSTLIQNNSLSFATFDDHSCYIEQQYYPALIHSDNVVKNDIDLSNNIIITGPNASGKTTSIKTTALNIIFTQQLSCGFYNKCKLLPFSHIHSYINIPDTSNRDSLFQAESRRCKDIIDNIINFSSSKYRHFCIIDELYSGTNPIEASHAGYALLKYLSQFNHASFILTTHYTYICKKFKKSKKIKNFKMKVDVDDQQRYHFKYKIIPGISQLKGAIKVLKELNYPSEIINTIQNI